MWAQSRAPTPDYARQDDQALRQHGKPDLILVIRGHRLHVHSSILKTYTSAFLEAVMHPDPYYGRLVIIPSAPAGRLPRTRAGVVALLNSIYPPRLLPPLELIPEVYDIAREYGMPLLVQKLRAGLLKNSDLGTLKLAEERDIWPELLLDVFAEFATEELEALPGYDELHESTKARVAEHRAVRQDLRAEAEEEELLSGVARRSEGKAGLRARHAWPPERLKRTWLAQAAAPGGAAGRCGAGGWTNSQLLSTCSSPARGTPSRPRSASCTSQGSARGFSFSTGRSRELSTSGTRGPYQSLKAWR